MNKNLKTILIIIGILFVIIVPLIKIYNNMVNLDQEVKNLESNIDIQLKKRSDLIPDLMKIVKVYEGQEKETFTDIADSRKKLGKAQSISEKADTDNELTSSLSKLLVIVEKHPKLKSNQKFKDLSIALEGCESRISIARQDYNKAVDTYNTSIKKFPNSIVASMGGFKEKPYYEISKNPKKLLK